MMQAGIYVRVSARPQSEFGTSLETQEVSCRAAAIGAGYTVADDHIWRETHSGATLDRPVLAQVREAARGRTIDAIWIHDWDRLSRDPLALLRVVTELAEYGVLVQTVTGSTSSGPEGKLMLYVEGFIGAQEREQIIDRSKRGKLYSAQRGIFPVGDGRGVYGYRYLQEHRMREVVPEEAAVVKEIFSRVQQGESLFAIANELNRRDIPTKRGCRWESSTIRNIVERDAYYGIDYYGRSRVRQYPGPGTRVAVPRSEWISVEGHTPPIISKEQFDRANLALQERRVSFQRRTRSSHQWLLKGFAKCALCDRPLRGKAPGHYICEGMVTRSVRPKRCQGRHMPKNQLEATVWSIVSEAIADPEMIATDLMTFASHAGSVNAEIRQVRNTLAAVERRQDSLMSYWQNHSIPADVLRHGLQELTVEWERERTRLQDLEKACVQSTDVTTYQAQLLELCEQLSGRMEVLTWDERRHTLEIFGVTVVASREQIEVRMCISPEAKRFVPQRTIKEEEL